MINIAILLYLVAFIVLAVGKRKAGRSFYFAGFIFAAIAFLIRWREVYHIPLGNMSEVFLFMGIFVYPVSFFCRVFLLINEEIFDVAFGIIFLCAVRFAFNSQPQMLPPALQSWLFGPHITVYLIAYILMIKASIEAVYHLIKQKNPGQTDYEYSTYKLICLGFPLLTLGLVLGSWWAKIAWGDYWGWDPKELWSLACGLIYVEYFHFRAMFGKKYSKINSIIAILGVCVIFLTLLWVNFARIFQGLHNYAV